MVALADQIEMKTLHMVTSDPFRTPTFTPFADPDWFFFATERPRRRARRPACASIPARTSQSFAWNHGDIQDEIAITWAGYVGPGVKNLGDDRQRLDRPHRPPSDAADAARSEGRLPDATAGAVTQIADENALPVSLRVHHPSLEKLADSYKQLMASFGMFSMDTLTASTHALRATRPGDADLQLHRGLDRVADEPA